MGAKNSEEKAKKAMVDAARLADELRAEQDHVNTQAKAKRALETQMVELENRLAEANENAIRGGRTAMAKLEARIRELEIELGNVQSRTSENSKGYAKSERRVKELAFQIDEDKKNQDRMSELATKLQQKIKTYKKQIEEGPAGAGGERGKIQDGRGPADHRQADQGRLFLLDDVYTVTTTTLYNTDYDDPSEFYDTTRLDDGILL